MIVLVIVFVFFWGQYGIICPTFVEAYFWVICLSHVATFSHSSTIIEIASVIVTNLTHVLHHVFLNFGSMDVQVVGQKLVSFGINGKFGFIGVCNKVTT